MRGAGRVRATLATAALVKIPLANHSMLIETCNIELEFSLYEKLQ